ncbi:hypothetical protein TPDSL_25610 [Terrisporobacter petrolearius]|uniref:hypothetical protein n=1 Tax=Terrisporobacter petrolearius TaxID=1460447 RepID=UPI0011DE0DDF
MIKSMKKILIVTIAIMPLILTACGNKKEVGYVGVNAQILEISKEVKGMVVKPSDDESILGKKCYINCENPETSFVYVDNKTGKTTDLNFDKLKVGDKITVDVKNVENKCALTSRVQLLTQRK